jgi:hypothetical protein
MARRSRDSLLRPALVVLGARLCALRDSRSGVRFGASVMLYPMYRITNVDDHIETLRRFNEVASG